jgi:high-affinity nickel-transport protein
MFATISGTVLGLLVGLRHALEPDHLAALSTLVVEGEGGPRRGAVLGALWGLGHTAALVLVGGGLLLTGAVLPLRAAAAFELLVAAMLIGLGLRAIIGALREGRVGAEHVHRHGGHAHAHRAPTAHVHLSGRPLALRPLLVGLVHGLAGSGALTALVFAQLPTLAARLGYVVVFGVGSIAGMSLASALASASLGVFTQARSAGHRRVLGLAVGALSTAVGIAWAIAPLAALDLT